MAVNDFFSIEDEMNLSIYKSSISTFKKQRSNQSTLEGSIEVESNYINFVREILEGNFKNLIQLNEFDQLRMQNYPYNIKYLNRKFFYNINRLNLLEKKYLTVLNKRQFLLQAIEGKLKRIKQKKSALELWKDEYSFVFLEKFLNRDHIKDDYSREERLFFDYDQGIALLPIKQSKIVPINKLKIKSGNGIPGNSDDEITGFNQRLASMLDQSIETWFEYERLDSGPLELELECFLNAKTILNKIELYPFIESEDLGYSIEDIIFYRDKTNGISIRKLVDTSQTNFNVSLLNDGDAFRLNFLPVECSSFTIKFVQKENNMIEKDRRLFPRSRYRYSIGIRSLELYSITYQTKGEASSTELNLVGSNLVGEVIFNGFPKNNSLYSYFLDVNFQKNWKSLTFEKQKSNSFLLDGDEENFSWKLFLEKKVNEFKNKSSYEEELSKLRYKSKYVNKKINPCILSLTGKVKEEQISCYCQTGLVKTNNRKKFSILDRLTTATFKLSIFIDSTPTETGTEKVYVDIPISLKRKKILAEDIGISVNLGEWTQVESTMDLDSTLHNYYISYVKNCVVFLKDSLPAVSKIRWWHTPEKLFFEQKSNFVYAKFKDYFNINKEEIDIKYLSSKSRRGNFNLKPGIQKFFLGKEGIDRTSIDIVSDAFQFTLATDRDALTTYSGSDIAYFFEEETGVLYLHEPISSKSLNIVNFLYRERRSLTKAEYEIWEEDSVPLGIKIKKSHFKAEELKDYLYEENEFRFSNINNRLEQRGKLFDNATYAQADEKRAFKLSIDSIVKGSLVLKKEFINTDISDTRNVIEVDFIDGESEFLGLEYIKDERTTAIEVDSQTSILEFSLAARARYYHKLGITIEDNEYFINYNTDHTAPLIAYGDYTIDPEGKIQLLLGSGDTLAAGIKYSYYYEDNLKASEHQFSIDYEEGILYTSKDILSGAYVTYKSANYSAEYEVLSRIKDFNVDYVRNEVELNSGTFLKHKSKVFLYYKTVVSEYSLEEIQEFFSPIVYNLRFNFK